MRWTIIIAIILLTGIYMFRPGIPLVTDAPYSDINKISSSNIFEKNTYHYVIQGLGSFFSYEISLVMISYVSAVISILLLIAILNHYRFRQRMITISVLVFIFSAQFISNFTISIRSGFELMLLMLSFYLFLKDKKIAFVFILLFSIMNIYYILIAIMMFMIFYKRSHNRYLVFYSVLVLLYYVPGLLQYGFPFYSLPLQVFFIKEFFSDFGGLYGMGFFKFILAVIGAFLMWRKNKKIYLLSFVSLILLIATFIYPEVNFIFMPIATFFCAYAINYYFEIRWKVELVKNLTLIVIMCGILFSFLSFFLRPPFPPDAGLIDTMQNLGEGRVLTHHSYGNMLEYYSDSRAVIKDDYYSYDPRKHMMDIQDIYMTRNLKEALSIMKKKGIDKIMTTRDMKSGLVWDEQGEGLQFLFRNEDVFEKIYDKENQIYQVNYDLSDQ